MVTARIYSRTGQRLQQITRKSVSSNRKVELVMKVAQHITNSPLVLSRLHVATIPKHYFLIGSIGIVNACSSARAKNASPPSDLNPRRKIQYIFSWSEKIVNKIHASQHLMCSQEHSFQ